MPERYINTDVAPGGDGQPLTPYSNRNEAFEAEAPNMLSGETWKFYYTGIADDTSFVMIDGIYAGTTAPICIEWLPWHTYFGAESDHPNGWYTGNLDWSDQHGRHVGPGGGTGSNDIITMHIDFPTGGTIAHEVVIAGQLGSQAGGRGRGVVTSGGTGVQIVRFKQLRYKSFDTGVFPRVWRGAGSNDGRGWHRVIFENVLIHYTGNELMSVMNPNYVGPGNTTIEATNLTCVYSGNNGEDLLDNRDSWTARMRNIVCLDNNNGDDTRMVGTGTTDFNYIAHQRTDNRGANGTSSAQSDMENYAGNDFRPASTSVWGAAGLTNAEDTLVPLDDINGSPRNNGVGEFTAFGAFAASGEGGNPGDITASLETIAVNAFAAAIETGQDVAANLEAITVTPLPGTVAIGTDIAAALEAVAVTALPAVIGAGNDIAAGLEAVLVQTFGAEVSVSNDIAATLEAITVTPRPAQVGLSTEIAAAIEVIQVAPRAATVQIGGGIIARLESITVAPQAAAVELSISIPATMETLVLTAQRAAVSIGADVAAVREQLVLTPQGASISFGVDISAELEAIEVQTLRATISGSGMPPKTPGLELTVPTDRMHYTVPVSRIHFTISEE